MDDAHHTSADESTKAKQSRMIDLYCPVLAVDLSSAGYLGGEPGHDMERRLDELHRHLQQQRHAEAARADARDGQPDDPDDGADEGDDDGEEREGQAQQPPQGPALAVAAAHPRPVAVDGVASLAALEPVVLS